ncbi:transposable element-related [Anaeramoeba flamelloides]|uniref:Transposable element-related n=1 Tax=Anaeramoeba flamelloides TaxID=1746091 RepID=A0AAV7Y580_9EUKA|nr:transposable element-related [Anaeramoeba flamelloides]
MSNQEIRINILSLRNSGYSLRQIAIHLDINVSKVRYWLRKWEDEKRITNKKTGPKNNKITQELKNFVEQETKKNRSMSSLTLSKKCQEIFCMDERKKFGKKVMIWGGIEYRLQTDLIIIGSSVDTETYIHDIIRKSKIIKKANEQYGEWGWIFQQDGARPHTSKKSMDYLQYRCNVLSPWPPNSPDLNPIEILWSIMDKRLKNVQPSNEEEFILEIIRVWEGITWEIIENLVTSMTKRIDLVIDHEGQSINGFF